MDAEVAARIGKDQVSRLCRGLDEQVRIFRERPLEGAYPYLWVGRQGRTGA
jgi:putative transposase